MTLFARIVAIAALCAVQAAQAESSKKYFTANLTHGTAEVDVAGYGDAWVNALELEYHATTHFGFSLTRYMFSDFNVHKLSSAELALDASEIAAVVSFRPAANVVVQGRVGYLPYTLTASALGHQIGEEEDGTTVPGLGAQFEFNPIVGLQLYARRAEGLSDATLTWYGMGFYARFGPP